MAKAGNKAGISVELAQEIMRNIRDGYHERDDYPSYELAAWDDRNKFLAYIERVLKDMAK